MLSDQEFKNGYRKLLTETHIVNGYGSPQELKVLVLINPEVKIWLSKLSPKTHRGYIDGFLFFLRCINVDNPSSLLDLKGYEDIKARFFPAEQLLDYWILIAKEKKVPAYRIKKVVDAVRSFFMHSRVELHKVSFTYKPKDKPALSREDLLHFRDNMTAHGRRIFDFLLSVPLRDGQFSICKHCGKDFNPRWRHIVDFPKIEPYSAFVIQPEKGHESPRYSQNLAQVCFLTQSAATQLQAVKALREKAIGRPMTGEDYIFTYSQDKPYGERMSTPLTGPAVKMIYYLTQPRAGLRVYPHLIRSYVNPVLAACGIDKQVRDIYLGHSCSYEMGYVMQMIPVWREQFQKRHVMETLDILNPSQHEVIKLEQQINKLQEDKDAQLTAMKNDINRMLDERFRQIREGLG